MLLEIDHLCKTYKGGVLANDDISLAIDAGEVFGLLGPNGAGKTTLVNQVLGSVIPTSGAIRIAEVDVVRHPDVARRLCSYQPQTSVPIDALTPLQAIELSGRIRGMSKTHARGRAAELLASLGLDEWAAKVVPLSGGVARLVAFCMASVAPGRIVILDEPTNDVDPLRRKMLWTQVRALADAGSAVLLVTHNVLEAERCVDRLAIIDHGRLLSSGTAASLKKDTGRRLRIEIVWEPGLGAHSPPAFLHDCAQSGRRLIGELEPSDVQAAIDWATAARDAQTVEEFSIGPMTLEDIYVRQVTQDEAPAAVA